MKMTNRINKKITKAICIFLALFMGLLLPLQVYAGSYNVKYLSDIKLYYAKSADEAKTDLEKEGYTFLNNNLNNGTERDTQVYLAIGRLVLSVLYSRHIKHLL